MSNNPESNQEPEIKTVVIERVNADGKKVKVTQKIRTVKKQVKVSKNVLDRKKNWKKFGACAGLPLGQLEDGITYLSPEEVQFIPVENKKEPEKTEKQDDSSIPKISCRNCGGSHWSHKCDKAKRFDLDKPEGKAGVYTPPRREKEITSLRISNLSEEAIDADLRDIFQVYGPIQRVTIGVDKVTGRPKGFAYVTFYERADAQKALDNTIRVGLYNLIISCEWARN